MAGAACDHTRHVTGNDYQPRVWIKGKNESLRRVIYVNGVVHVEAVCQLCGHRTGSLPREFVATWPTYPEGYLHDRGRGANSSGTGGRRVG